MPNPTTPTPTPLFDTVAIIGVGLLGASLGLALKQRRLARQVLGVGRANSPSLQIALDRQAIDLPFTNPIPAVAQANLVILATPVRQFPTYFQLIAPHLQPQTLITDVGSTKSQVCQWAADLLPKTVHFIGSHPMAGSEKFGPAHASSTLYDNALCILTPTSSDPAPLATLQTFWQSIHMRTLILTPAVHDQFVAAVSHLPHAAAAALIATAARNPAALQCAAGGLSDTTRIAAGDIDMWTDIFLTNKDALSHELSAFIQNLESLRSAIAQSNEPAIRAHLTHAKAQRDHLLSLRTTNPQGPK